MKNSKNYKFTVIIPTFNRSEYLKRLLGYYNKQGSDYTFKIIVADSSSEKDKLRNKEMITSFSNLDISYFNHFPENTHPFKKQLFVLGCVDTKYCVICPDDDFIMVKAINCAVNFFETHPDYTCVHGRHLRFYLKGNKKKRRFYWHFTYNLKSISDPDPQKRVISYLTTCPCNVLFAVYPTKFLKMAMGETQKYARDGFFGEILLFTLPFIYGKMKTLDMIYSPKNALSTPKNTNIDHFMYSIDYKRDGTYDKKFSCVVDCLSKHLSNCSGKSIEECKKFISFYLTANINKQDNAFHLNLASFFHRIRFFMEAIKMPRFLYNLLSWPYQKLFILRGVKLLKEIPPTEYYNSLRDFKRYLIGKYQ